MIRRWSPAGVGMLPDGTFAGADAGSQTRQIFANLETLLDSAGAGPRHVLKLFTMVAGTEHLAGSRAARAEVFARWYPDGDWPAHSLIVVAALATPEILVEVEAYAAIPALG